MALKCGLFVRLEAKPGKERAVKDFLVSGLDLTNQEAGTPVWFAMQLSPTTFGVFDAFTGEEDRQAHLAGNMAKALMSRVEEMLARPPSVEPVDVLAVKKSAGLILASAKPDANSPLRTLIGHHRSPPGAEMVLRNGQTETYQETPMSLLRKTSAIALVLAMTGAVAHAQTKPAAKEVVIVHGALADGSGWRAVYDILTKDGFHVTIVQEPLTGLAEDVDATKRVIDQQTGPVVLVGHSYGGSVITEAGADPKVSALVYVAALQPDKGEASGALMSKFAAPNDAMRVSVNKATPDNKYFFIPAAKFRETYAQDVPAEQAQFMADSEQQLAQKAMGAPLSVAAWHNKPSYAILTTEDHVISPELQRWMYKRSGAKVTEVPASHAVFVSQPAAIARVIEDAAK